MKLNIVLPEWVDCGEYVTKNPFFTAYWCDIEKNLIIFKNHSEDSRIEGIITLDQATTLVKEHIVAEIMKLVDPDKPFLE